MMVMHPSLEKSCMHILCGPLRTKLKKKKKLFCRTMKKDILLFPKSASEALYSMYKNQTAIK